MRRDVPTIRNDRGKSEYTGQHIIEKQKHSCRHSWAVEVCEWIEQNSRVMSVSKEFGIEYRKTHWILATFARILHSSPYFFMILFPTSFSLRSRMTGRYSISFCEKPFLYLLTHTPFVNLSVATFPDKRGQLTLFILSFCNNYHLISFIKNYDFFFLGVGFPRTRR